MGIELVNAGETLAAIVVSNELSKQANGGGDNPQSSTNGDSAATCANCGTSLAGAYCYACGQSSHIHRSLLHMFEEVLHGIFHFDTKAWRTIPALIRRPGQLTKDYIQGKRTSYVSPLALFLFLIFVMFFVFSLTMKDPSNEILNIPESRETVVKELANSQANLAEEQAKLKTLPANSGDARELRLSIRETQLEIRQWQDSLDALDGKEFDNKAAQQEFAEAEKNLVRLRTLQAQLGYPKEDADNVASFSIESSTSSKSEASASASSGASTSTDIAAIKPWDLREEIRFAKRELKFYRKRITKANKSGDTSKSAENSGKIGLSASADSTASTEQAKNKPAASTSQTSQASDTENSPQEKTEGEDDTNNLSDIPYVGKALAHADKNRALTLYKMKKNAASSAFLLMPISLPFLWLLFAFKRKYVMFDHAVFSLYSLSFMCLLLMLISILARFNFTGTAGLLFLTVPPIHMFRQLRQAYDLGVLSTLWRTVALLLIAFLSLLIYATVVTMLST
ncbi:DUF3667 domain-containing protein [Undibacterium flavidum]|uniref:DUF3667 domain-containing protein n=1 Tax=Undibacterium flavidum TaxID=2762297 RepID=A0ABR6Y7E3_9BURK|nr:DUF3667 domain-containing protein [Undibacterium flavidum]MBC3872519.1 DUF3667 domain-containing protein [Undibacterium flavidum]